RRPLAFVFVVALAVFAAHMYIVDSPSATTRSTVSGPANGAFGDSHLQVNASLTGTRLSIHVVDNGSNAIGRLSISLNNVSIPTSNLQPEPTITRPLEPMSASFLGYPTEAVGLWTVSASQSSRLTVNYDYLTCFHVPDSGDHRAVLGCVMDETYYVPSAQSILAGTQCAPFAENCNLEHPPLAKALIAGGIAVFGLNDLGWRIAEVVTGTLSIPLLYVLVYILSGDRRLSVVATLIFAADVLFFVHSSIAVIDVPAVFFSLLAFILYFRPGRLWRVNNYVASGVCFGLAALSKETALFALMAAITYELLFGGGGIKASTKRSIEAAGFAVLTFAGGLQLFDALLTSAALPWFYQQVQFMLSYGSSLKVGPQGGGWCLNGGSCPQGPYITPLNWLGVYNPVGYLVTKVTVTVTGATTSVLNYVAIGYYGIANQVIVWMVFLWVPVAAYSILKTQNLRSALSAENKVGAFALVWFLWSYVPYLVLWFYGRVTYPFYFLPAIPALATGAAYFMRKPWFPQKMIALYIIAAFGIFFLYFPVKDFLPDYVRAMLGH
ncbi:MAG: glycosyltransferase family 39 protein, partial [Thaumarchaeota archaeon]|nr:glycosyltransferase family 39 protein [Nitrososphaerota archaeon]